LEKLRDFPSIQFGLEQALLSLYSNDMFELFPSSFSRGEDEIPINGLIWMGTEDFMMQQIRNKLQEGFTTLKMKIGALNFETELRILNFIRSRFGPDDLELRVDANGAFEAGEAIKKLKRLAIYDIHSIEQPLKAGLWEDMARLCKLSPIPVALDEELIGITDPDVKKNMLETIRPRYIILKPSLVGWIR
jgi:L-alanine-DL-glutamate epimerase-like enolase superfamily enzyme